ncbi:voltage-gated chloride channel [Pseudohyphozyma bogoriensis]|nr:voltage-gated chloride channel [Pseudohyphozyma bogoriensis]
MPPPSTTPTERSPLLRTTLSSHHLSSLAASADTSDHDAAKPQRDVAWLSSVKRRSALLSDMMARGSHSAFEPPRLPTEEEDELDSGGLRSPLLSPYEDAPRGGGRGVKRAWGYDGEFRKELEYGETGNGVRVWYDNFHSIDWIHDGIKNALRTRKLRMRARTEGVRGWWVNVWDAAQGWMLVTLIGFLTACVAWVIIRAEGLFFDLKTGYCSTNPRLSKRFCCPEVQPVMSNLTIARGAVGGVSFLNNWRSLEEEETCAAWRTWGEVWSGSKAGNTDGDVWPVDLVAFIVLALGMATLASTLTIYLSSSTSVYSSKDSPSVPHPGFSPDFPTAPMSSSIHSQYGATSTGVDDEEKLPPPRARRTMYFASGSGIPEIKTILSGFVIRGYLGTWTLATKSVGLALSVASGLSLGKEGPFVHIASCVGNILSRAFPKYDRNEAKRREIISAACAAGVAVSFGAPVGGTLFSLEEVSYFFPPKVLFRSFFCAMIAAVTLKLLNPFGSGKIVLFAVTYDRDWHTFELAGFALLGALGGIYGALFCKANIWWTKHARNGTFLKFHPIVEVALVTFVTVCVSLTNSFTRSGGTELVASLFSECHRDDSFGGLCVNTPELAWKLIGSLLFALVAKALLTVTTFGIRLPAGIFIPTLAVGACAGRVAGLLVEIAHARWPEFWVFESCRTMSEDGPLPFGQSCVLPGVAVGTLAGVTRTTVSLAVIMFELTGTLSYSVPVMLSILLAKTVGDAIEPRSIYDLVIELSDLPYLEAKMEYVHESTPGEVLDDEAPFISLDEDNTVHSLRMKLARLYSDGSGGGFPIVGKDGEGSRVYGYIAAKELEHGLTSAGLSSPNTPCTFRVSESIRSGQPLPASRGTSPNGHDFSWLTDIAPVTVNVRSPMEYLHEMYVKLGVRYILVTDERGLYLGVIEKNRWLKYLEFVEKVQKLQKTPPGWNAATAASA